LYVHGRILSYSILDDHNFEYRGEHVYSKLRACRGM
jgi:hypothetical protein